MEYLEFELPIKELEDQLQKCQIIGKESDVDVSETSLQILQKLDIAKKEIYRNKKVGVVISGGNVDLNELAF